MKTLLIALITAAFSLQAQPTYTQITDTIYTPLSGQAFTGRLYISSPVIVGTSASSVGGWLYSKAIVNGAVSVALVPNDTAQPAGTTYIFRFVPQSGSTWTQYCTVPTSGSPVKLAAICAVIVPSQPAPFSPVVMATDVGTGADTSEDNLISYTLPGGRLTAGKYLTIRAHFSALNSGGANSLYFGGVQVCTSAQGSERTAFVTVIGLTNGTQKISCSIEDSADNCYSYLTLTSAPSSSGIEIKGTGINIDPTAGNIVQRMMLIEAGNF